MDVKDVLEVVVGIGDGMLDAGVEYLDEVANTRDQPVLKKASTWGHVAIGGALIASKFLGLTRDKTGLIAMILGGRHIGKVVGDVLKEAAAGQPVFGGPTFSAPLVFETPAPAPTPTTEVTPPVELPAARVVKPTV